MKYLVFCIKTLFLLCILSTLYKILNTKILAYTSQDDSYILHMQIDPYEEDNQEYNQLPQTTNPVSPSLIQRKTLSGNSPTPTIYIPQMNIQTGFFSNPQATSDFRFSIANDLISFGPLSPTDFITRNLSVSVSGDPSYLYTIKAYENHELNDDHGDFIPNTRCDTSACNDVTAGPWVNTLTFGFGYRCENSNGSDCAKEFLQKDFFKHFTLDQRLDNGQTLMSGILTEEKKANILYQVNVSGSQQPGTYQNTVTYLALPMY